MILKENIMFLKKFFTVFLHFVVFSTIIYANSCPKWMPMPSDDGLVVVIPLYDESITGPDMDCDEILDAVDSDMDGDGVANGSDAFPVNPNESIDTDGDGVGNNADNDDDGDGYSDSEEITAGSDPLDASSVPPQNLAPTIITENQNILENQISVVTVEGTNPDGDTLSWSLTGGADQTLFSIDGNSGDLTFSIAPNFENPTDTNTDNVYVVEITVDDGNGGNNTKTLSITVTDEIEIVNFTIDPIANINQIENSVYTSLTPNLIGDAPIGEVTYTLSGTDASSFDINSSTGIVSMVQRDYETPQDSNTDNIYEVNIVATDSDGNSDSEDWNVSIVDIATEDFIITVKTNESGASLQTEFIIPTYPLETYNYNVDCNNDGINEATGITGDYKCQYATEGNYTIVIKDNSSTGVGFPRIYFNNTGDKYKIIGINQWGTNKWSSMQKAFYGCLSLNEYGGAAMDSPNLSNVTDMSFMFSNTYWFNQDIGDWNTSTVTNMSNILNFRT